MQVSKHLVATKSHSIPKIVMQQLKVGVQILIEHSENVTILCQNADHYMFKTTNDSIIRQVQ